MAYGEDFYITISLLAGKTVFDVRVSDREAYNVLYTGTLESVQIVPVLGALDKALGEAEGKRANTAIQAALRVSKNRDAARARVAQLQEALADALREIER